MKALIVAADGFVGRNIFEKLRNDPQIQAITSTRDKDSENYVDLLDRSSISAILDRVKPDVIINSAGVVSNTEDAYKNGEFTRNILDAVVARGEPYPRIIVSGSAAEYGVVAVDGSVNEEVILAATNHYGKSKVDEENIAHEYARKYGIGVVVTRIFNPIGPDMADKFLLTSLLRQIDEVKTGIKDNIELSRLDAARDYVDVRDVASAVYKIVKSPNLQHDVYNIGSGKRTTNNELVQKLLSFVKIDQKPTIIETQDTPEPPYAAQADITRIKQDTNWQPEYGLEQSIEDIVSAKSRK